MPWFGFEPDALAAASGAQRPQACLPLAERHIGRFDPTGIDASPGRRLRAFAALVCVVDGRVVMAPGLHTNRLVISSQPGLTYAALLELVDADCAQPGARRAFERFPLRIGEYKPLIQEVPKEESRSPRDPDLHPALQDLGDEINEDIREALEALDNGSAWYPGIDEGIEPVPDDHVRTVIWALQRELDRELRVAAGSSHTAKPLPAAPLSDLPWHVQRALAERRRWRYKQWGLGREQWLADAWSLWEIPEEPEYVPRRSARIGPGEPRVYPAFTSYS